MQTIFNKAPILAQNFIAVILTLYLVSSGPAETAESAENNGTQLEPDVIFCIGHPDSYCDEFALAKEGYAHFPNQFGNGVLFEVGKSTPKNDWPFLHPSKQDESWAKGGPSHPFTIRFNSDKTIDSEMALVIGYIGVQGDLSNVLVNINDTSLPAQLPQNTGNGNIVHRPSQKGRADAMIFAIPTGSIREGTNTITITLEGKSWILYDYVALRKEPKHLQNRERPEVDLLTPFRSNSTGPMSGISEIVFAARPEGIDGHWYANFGYYADNENRFPAPFNGGKLCVYNIDSKQVRTLLDDPNGRVRDPQVDYEGTKILFSYRPGETEFYHLYEINIDGTGLRQLTNGEFDDMEPTYTPTGDIIFVSSRANRWVQCWLTPVAILFGCDANGQNLHQLSGNVEQDNTPWVLPNGQILYTRWEYIDRSQVDYHHLWTMNPDGTRQMVFYGNMHPSTLFIDAKPIPGSEKIVASFSWGHGSKEHAGAVGVIDPRLGPDDKSAAQVITRENRYRDPWAFSESAFLAATGTKMVLIDAEGQEQTIFELEKDWKDKRLTLHEPRPVIQRVRERSIGKLTNDEIETGHLNLIDVYNGRNMEGIKRGEIKKLLILETLPKPINFTGGMEPMTYGGSFSLERIVGTVPVEADGSANFELPALRSFFFVALDENDMAVKRMQSFLSVMPGESTTCIGCHEERTATPQRQNRFPLAARRSPSPITPIADFRGIDPLGQTASTGIPDVIDYPRDIQPIWDAHCIQCHSPDKRDGGVSLVGDRTPLYSISYYTITAKKLIADGRNLAKGNYPPKTLGSGASKIMTYCDGSHYDTKLSDREKTLVRLWCETGATYLGTYSGLGCGMIGGYSENSIDRQDLNWPEMQASIKVLQSNCIECHTSEKNNQLPLSPSDEIGGPPWENMRPNDVRRTYSRNLLYNLTRPEKSTILLAPLSKEAGGYESCGKAVLTGTDDPNYQTILAGITRTKEQLDSIKRFDMPGFVARPQYIREMKKYGILPPHHDPATPVDLYLLEQEYWRSHWYKTGVVKN
ncbi:MAG: polysaccharide lyase family protein [Thermoguttaceae bacterium]